MATCPICQSWALVYRENPKLRKCDCGNTFHPQDARIAEEYSTCNKCNWVHFNVSRGYAEDAVQRFKEYYDTLSEEKQKEYYGGKPSSIKDYERCHRCNNPYENFRPSKYLELPNGSTISPIIKT